MKPSVVQASTVASRPWPCCLYLTLLGSTRGRHKTAFGDHSNAGSLREHVEGYI